MKAKILVVFFCLLGLTGCGSSGYTEGELQAAIDKASNTAYNDGYQAAKDDMEREAKESSQEVTTYSEEEMYDLIFYAYFEGYTDAQEGYDTEYIEVTVDDLDLSDYYSEYDVFSEDDADQLCALYYTEGYKDSESGKYPEFSSDVEECCGSPSSNNKSKESSPTTAQTSYESHATEPEANAEPESDPQESTTTSTDTQSVTVYVTNTGTKYHKSGCGYLSQSKNAVSLSAAKAAGYTPCSRCHPPQ